MTNLKLLAIAASVFAVSATASVAATYTVNGTDYDVKTITGSFNDNQALLESQIWWGDDSLAIDFASAVAGGIGPSNDEKSLSTGPFFLFSEVLSTAPFVFNVAMYNFGTGAVLIRGRTDPTLRRTFAIAEDISAVPLPAPALMLLSGIGGMAALKRRKKRAS